jgi:hypothetical protein
LLRGPQIGLQLPELMFVPALALLPLFLD